MAGNAKTLDPLDADRIKLKDLAAEDAMYGVLYELSQGFELDHACLRADVLPEDFEVWKDAQQANSRMYEKARRLGVAKYKEELRNVALGHDTRRGQMPALKIAMERFDITTKPKHTGKDGKDRAPDPGSRDLEHDLAALEAEAGYSQTPEENNDDAAD